MNSLEEIVKSTSGQTREVLEQLVHQVAESVKEKQRLEQTIKFLAHDLRLLKKRLFGTSSEQSQYIIPEQLDADLIDDFVLCEHMIDSNIPEAPVDENKASAKKTSCRKPLP